MRGITSEKVELCTEPRRFQFMRPPIADPEDIAAERDDLQINIQCLADTYELQLAALDELKRSLLHQTFSGGLS